MRTLTSYNEDNFRQIEQYKGISVVRFFAALSGQRRDVQPVCRPARWRYTGGESQCRSGTGADNQIRDLGLPSVLIFHEGQLVKRIPGVKPASVYAQAITDIKKGQ